MKWVPFWMQGIQWIFFLPSKGGNHKTKGSTCPSIIHCLAARTQRGIFLLLKSRDTWLHSCGNEKCLVAQLCLTLQPHGLLPARLLCPWDSPSRNTGVGCHALLQGIEPRSLTLQADSLPSEPPGKPRKSERGLTKKCWVKEKFHENRSKRKKRKTNLSIILSELASSLSISPTPAGAGGTWESDWPWWGWGGGGSWR